MSASDSTKYDMRINPVYQIDFQVFSSGKRVSTTKRRVSWRFGFSNKAAILQGQVGNECRGEEHEVTLIWSLTSGKHEVLLDGREIHFSRARRPTETHFETCWTMGGGHVMKVIAHAIAPLQYTPGFRQYDLLLDGCSFFDMTRIFELGCSPTATIEDDDAVVPIRAGSPTNVATADEQLGFALRAPEYSTPNPQRGPLYEKPREVAPTATTKQQEPSISVPASSIDLLTDNNLVIEHDFINTSNNEMTISSTPNYFADDEFAPVPIQQQQFISIPSSLYQNATNSILSAYHSTPARKVAPPMQTANVPAYSASDDFSVYSYGAQDSQSLCAASCRSAPTVTLTMGPMNFDDSWAMEETQKEQRSEKMSEMDKALSCLVNLQDIHETVSSPEEIKKKNVKAAAAAMNSNKKSTPIRPTGSQTIMFGPDASLSTIQQSKSQSVAPKREIMRTYGFDPAAARSGMMVVYGAQPCYMTA